MRFIRVMNIKIVITDPPQTHHTYKEERVKEAIYAASG
jgi:hypothetical protein